MWNGIRFRGIVILRSPGNADTPLELMAGKLQSKVKDENHL